MLAHRRGDGQTVSRSRETLVVVLEGAVAGTLTRPPEGRPSLMLTPRIEIRL
jgi:hypothetical protein